VRRTSGRTFGLHRTLLIGIIAGQPALFSTLERVQDMNLLPILVGQIDEEVNYCRLKPTWRRDAR